jgi:uncharacterized Zn-finger protein
MVFLDIKLSELRKSKNNKSADPGKGNLQSNALHFPISYFWSSMTLSAMFILFFGTRTGKKRQAPIREVSCPYCGQTGFLHATVIPHFVHLFWIPVYRLKPMAFVECQHCKKAYEGNDLTPEMKSALESL